MTLYARDHTGELLGTLVLKEGKLSSPDNGGLEQMARQKTAELGSAEKAYTELNGRNNGYVSISEDPEKKSADD